jgi:transcriptional regulator with XRE-family HTH domain
MPGIDGGTLRAWRTSRGWDVPQMERQLRDAARKMGVPIASDQGLKRMIYSWERNAHTITERYRRLYAAALGVVPDQLPDGPLRTFPLLSGPEHDLAEALVLSLTLGMTSFTLAAAGTDKEADVDRRQFGITAFGLLAGALAFTDSHQVTVTAADIRGLRETADEMWSADWNTGGNVLIRQAVRIYGTARAMLDNSTYSGPVGGDLQALCAELAACAGFTAFDAGHQPLARSMLSESALLAGSAGDPVPTAHAYALLAMQAISLGTFSRSSGAAREALRFLDMADGAARHEPSPRLHATIAMRRATASALLGNHVEVRKQIAVARNELDRGDHPRDPHWTGFVTPSEVTAHEAMASYAAGQPETAAALYRDVLADPALPARNKALYQARLAMSLHAAGDQAQAVTEGLTVLHVLRGPVRSSRALHQLQAVRQTAPADSEFAVRFDDAAAAYAEVQG